KGIVFLIVTQFAVTLPVIWLVLATINRRSRDFNLTEQRQLQIELRRERLEKKARTQGAES
ncbi:MAG TPA: hypothetical protein VFV34_21480, partial [Blastocatellia bacterium]|nr:hypothetical protein [Blastocatellia bacterium]